jgi:hypothetical protein
LALGEGVAPTPNDRACRDGKRAFDESQVRLSAHIRREDPGKLSVKGGSPVELQREAFAESFLSVTPSPKGKGPSPTGSLLSAKTPNPVVYSVITLLHLPCIASSFLLEGCPLPSAFLKNPFSSTLARSPMLILDDIHFVFLLFVAP